MKTISIIFVKLWICIFLFTANIVLSQTFFQKAQGSNFTYLKNIEKVNNNKFITCGYEDISGNNEAYLSCIDSLGAIIWTKKYGDASSLADEFRITKYISGGNLVSAGHTYSGPGGSRDAYIIKTDINGNLIWSKAFGSSSYDEIVTIAEDALGNIYCAGVDFVAKLDANGNLLWQKKYAATNGSFPSFTSLITLTSGDIILSGISYYSGLNHGVLLSLDASGNVIWSKNYVGVSHLSFSKVIALPNNEFAISGYYDTHYQSIHKTDALGNIIWSNVSTTYNSKDVGGLYLDPDSTFLYLAGNHVISYPQTQANLSKFDLSGTHLWEKEYGGCDEDAFSSIAFGNNATLYLAGGTRSYGTGDTKQYIVRADTSGYTSCFDDITTQNYANLNLTTSILNYTASASTHTYSTFSTITNPIAFFDSLICTSVNPVGFAFQSSDTTICQNSCISFSSTSIIHQAVDPTYAIDWFNGVYGSMSPKFQWSFPGATFTSGTDTLENPTTICYANSGTYNVNLTITVGCKSFTISKPNYIIVSPQPNSPTISGNTFFCTGNSTTLDAGAGYINYQWLPTGATTQTISVNSSGNYSVIVTNNCGSDTSQAVTITTIPLPTITISGSNSICLGASTTLLASGAVNYNWNTGTNSNSIIVSPNINTSYTVVAYDTNNCSNSATYNVTVNTIPTANAGVDQTICAGQSVTLNGSGGSIYTWNSGQNSQSISVSPSNTFNYILTASNGVCTDKDTVKVNVNPIPNLIVSDDITITQGDTAMLSVSGANFYNWSSNSSLSCTTCSTITVSPLYSSQYCVEASSINGCINSKCVNVIVDINCGELFVPDAFSPNGDGVNDMLQVFINKTCVKGFSLLIFDRWGEKIFESSDINTFWDGTYKGQALNNAVFVYYLNISFNNNDSPIIQKGNISIIK
ncbi:MAG: gliding motility-associated C-terminal domain-containing protein [Bacteroidota bacterium]|nr:gliding motility-associated C-terminal domain-containing protein [Bacteroidota bacterium]